ncbi:MAG: transketolase family protein [Candidatus Altarchaeaceae archaeon]
MKFYKFKEENLKILESTRNAYGDTLCKIGEKEKNLVVLDADLAESTQTIRFGKKFPDRFFDVGIAEQNLMGIAAGLALCKKIVFVSTFAIFATGRAWDQIRNVISHDKLNVKIVASHGGISIGEDGHSHQATEDIGLMRVIPEMRVIVPADATETRKVIEKIYNMEGPFYVRLTRPSVPKIFDDDYEFELGESVKLIDGDDVSIFACGIMVKEAIDAAKILKEKNIYASVINMSSIKPIDEKGIIKEAEITGRIITCEDHQINSGLGSAVAEILSEKKPTPLKRIGLKDEFGRSGSKEDLFKYYNMDSESIAKAAIELVKKF